MSAHEETRAAFDPDVGHLIRQLRLLESIYFDRGGGERFYLTLVNARPGRLGLALDVPRAGKVMLAIDADRGRPRLHVCPEPDRELATRDVTPGVPVVVGGEDDTPFGITVVEARRDLLELRFDVPSVGTVAIRFRLRHDRARAEIVAERAIRVVPTKRSGAVSTAPARS